MSDSLKRKDRVVVVGAGFAGTMVAMQLARRGAAVTLVGRGDQAGKGAAYSTEDPAHLLNIPAAKMSAWPDRLDDFVEAEGLDPEAYVPRLRFGHYLRAILDNSTVDLVEGEAVAGKFVDEGWAVRLADGRAIEAKALVLATGNQAPEEPLFARGLADSLFASDPWGPSGKAAIARAIETNSDVLAIGSGLTMIDIAMSLATAGHQGKLVAVSRRGQRPRVSIPVRSEVPSSDAAPSGSLAALWRWVRQRTQEIDWRDAVDSVRPRTHELWRSLSEADQRRFMRHARPWWDVHRHRIAPEAGAIVERMIAEGRMEVLAGRIQSLSMVDGGLEAVIRQRGATEADPPRRFAVAINCTGPLHAIAKSRDPLIRSLRDQGLATPDHLGIGLKLDEADRVIGAPRAWAVGSLGKARYWEIIAVPDIRGQADQVAAAIAEELKNG